VAVADRVWGIDGVRWVFVGDGKALFVDVVVTLDGTDRLNVCVADAVTSELMEVERDAVSVYDCE